MLWLNTSFGWAQPSPAPIDSVPLEKGEKAPYSGQLLTTELALRLGITAETCKIENEIRTEHAETLCKLRLESALASRKIGEESFKEQLKVCLSSCAPKQLPFWETPAFIGWSAFLGGTLLGAGVVVGAIWGVGQLRPSIPN